MNCTELPCRSILRYKPGVSAILQTVSHRLPNEFDPGSSHTLFVADIEADFLRVFRFLLPMSIPRSAPYSLIFPSPTLYSLDNESIVKLTTRMKSHVRLSRWRVSLILVPGCPLAWGLTALFSVRKIWRENIKMIMFLGSKVRLMRRADNLTAICEPIV
jgi:hypothetical protein